MHAYDTCDACAKHAFAQCLYVCNIEQSLKRSLAVLNFIVGVKAMPAAISRSEHTINICRTPS